MMKQDTYYVVPRYSKLMNKFMRAGSIISMCISAILAEVPMPIGIARLAWAPWNHGYF